MARFNLPASWGAAGSVLSCHCPGHVWRICATSCSTVRFDSRRGPKLKAEQSGVFSAAMATAAEKTPLCPAFNFGPRLESNRTVEQLVAQILQTWPGQWQDKTDPAAPHEAGKLNLAIDKAFHLL